MLAFTYMLVGKDKSDGCDKTKQGRDGQSKVAFYELQKAVKSREKWMRVKQEKEKKQTKKKGNGRYKRPFINLAKIISLPLCIVNVQ